MSFQRRLESRGKHGFWIKSRMTETVKAFVRHYTRGYGEDAVGPPLFYSFLSAQKIEIVKDRRTHLELLTFPIYVCRPSPLDS